MRVPILIHALNHAVMVLITGLPTSLIVCIAGKAQWSVFGPMLLNTAVVGAIGGVFVGGTWRVVDFLRERGQLPYDMREFTDKMSGVLFIIFFALGIAVPLLTMKSQS